MNYKHLFSLTLNEIKIKGGYTQSEVQLEYLQRGGYGITLYLIENVSVIRFYSFEEKKS